VLQLLIFIKEGNEMEATLVDILGWGYLDAKKLKEYFDIAKLYDIEVSDIRENIQDDGYNISDINQWFYYTIRSIYFDFCSEFQEYTEKEYPLIHKNFRIEEALQEAQDDFNPYINYLDSWFSNELDEMDLGNKEESFKSYLKVLINK